MVDEAYLDSDEWIKKSIRTVAKVCQISETIVLMIDDWLFRWASSAPIELLTNMLNPTGTLNRHLCRAVKSARLREYGKGQLIDLFLVPVVSPMQIKCFCLRRSSRDNCDPVQDGHWFPYLRACRTDYVTYQDLYDDAVTYVGTHK